MGLFNKKTNDNILNLTCPLIYLEGIPSLLSKTLCTISVQEDKLIIEATNSKQRIELEYSKIINCQQIANTETIQKNKSVIKRGIAGGILLGPTGAIVGGLSGVGSKEKTQLFYYLFITYKSLTSSETQTLKFQSMNYNNSKKIVEYINDKIPKDNNIIKL